MDLNQSNRLISKIVYDRSGVEFWREKKVGGYNEWSKMEIITSLLSLLQSNSLISGWDMRLVNVIGHGLKSILRSTITTIIIFFSFGRENGFGLSRNSANIFRRTIYGL